MSSRNRTSLACLLLLFFSASLLSHVASRLLSENSSYESHEEWMARYGRTYKDAAEKERRSKIFHDNVQYIQSFNNAAMNKGYKLAVNEFADLTNEEFTTARNRFKAHECSPSTSAFRYENVTAVPSSMDWRKKGAVTPIKDQGQCGNTTRKLLLFLPKFPTHFLRTNMATLFLRNSDEQEWVLVL
ncbi:putative fruit bromelain [Helianthus annuus]|uniref:Fruit bromelain n=1 Tax=Helianthus annuus TaxID=4232 RepID=A0A9K3DFI1_HELAN|nr:putative fruit bromelain [Helianthus annuus]KAJ0428435.1 putative fruit bromelain [Helianthus annuus]KAJ0432525.1 putative fruit bromelain [Helianthus annuus]KAJ0812318.1 putative fruit bromelain [Helianthus annuus]KAJ0812320.1 putative fruit bromelain [Helianthus annuus]